MHHQQCTIASSDNSDRHGTNGLLKPLPFRIADRHQQTDNRPVIPRVDLLRKTIPEVDCFWRLLQGNGGIHAREVSPPALHIEDETASAAAFAQAVSAFLSTRKEHAPGGYQQGVRDMLARTLCALRNARP